MCNIAKRALRQLNGLSTLDTSIDTSSLEEMFLSPISNELVYYKNQGVHEDLNITNLDLFNPDPTTNARTNNHSIVQGLKSSIDDSILAFASTQLTLQYGNSTTQASGMFTLGAVKVGTPGYVYPSFALNLFLILLYLEEMLWTRHWSDLPLFDHYDLKGVILASSMGGLDLANKIVAMHARKGSIWVVDPKGQTANNVRVQLKCRNDRSVELIALEGQEAASTGRNSDFKPLIG